MSQNPSVQLSSLFCVSSWIHPLEADLNLLQTQRWWSFEPWLFPIINPKNFSPLNLSSTLRKILKWSLLLFYLGIRLFPLMKGVTTVSLLTYGPLPKTWWPGCKKLEGLDQRATKSFFYGSGFYAFLFET